MKPAFKSVLLKTSAKTDLKYSGGEVTITGLQPVALNNITGLYQTKYRAEVAQVVTIDTSGITPTASTFYGVIVYDPNRQTNGQNELPKSRVYGYTTPPVLATIGANAAAQQEHINTEIAAAITTATDLCHATATYSTGNSIIITDNGGYFPPHSQSMTNVKGANTVAVITNTDGTGFPQGIVTTTTEAVYSQGVGAILLAGQPILDKMFGNLVSGENIYPLTVSGQPAVSGQQYDAFTISSLLITATPTITGHYTYREQEQVVFVDNGLGSATTNASGFVAFERQFHKLVGEYYSKDPNAFIEFFDRRIAFQDPLGLAPTGTANTLGMQISPWTSAMRMNIGTQTIVAPILGNDGLIVDQDDTNGEGSHTCAPWYTNAGQEFVVGTDVCTVINRQVAADFTDGYLMIGLRKKEAYTADFNDYNDLAAIGGGTADGDSVYTYGILGGAATVATDSTYNFTDATSAELMIKVEIDGKVYAYFNGVKCPIYSAGTTQLQFPAGTVLIPFYQYVNIGGGDPAMVNSEFVAVASNWVN